MRERLRRRDLLKHAATVALGGLMAPIARAAAALSNREVREPLYARLVGTGSPILFVHGLAASSVYWGDRFDVLARRHSLAFVDLAGFGNSLHTSGPYDLEGQLEKLTAFRRAHLAPDPVVLVGHSFGALLAVLAGARWKDVRAVVSISLPLLEGDLSERWRRVRAMGTLAAWAANDSGFGEASCKIMCATRPLVRHLGPLIDPTVPREVARAAFDHTWESLRGALDAAVAADARGWLADVSAPVIIVQGTRDEVCSAATVRRAAVGLPGSIQVREVDADHQLPLRNSRVCRAALRFALASTDTRARDASRGRANP